MKLYLNESPRTFVVASKNYGLIIRHPNPTYKAQSPHTHHHHHHHKTSAEDEAHVIVEFVRLDLLNLSTYKEITPSKTRHNAQLLAFIGFLNMKSNIYLGFITASVTAASPTPNEKVEKITNVAFYCLNNDAYDYYIHHPKQIDELQQSESDKITSDLPAASVRKMLSLGCFYYSTDFDVTSTVQERGFVPGFRLLADSPYYARFMWNTFMMSQLIEFRNRLSPYEQSQFDTSGFLTIVTRGYAKTVNTNIGGSEDALLTVISKQSCMKSGPLFGDWGADDDGVVSNYVETEVVIYSENFCFAYVVVRGNVPIFWELEIGKYNMIFSKKNKRVVFPRSFEASHHAFTRHFETLMSQFGDVKVVNTLTDDEKSYKSALSEKYKEHIKYFNDHASETGKVSASNYQLRSINMPIATATMKKVGYSPYNPYDIIPLLADSIIDFGAMFYDTKKQNFRGKQLGAFRINSFDSLNKSNFISKIISQEVIELALRDIGLHVSDDLLVKHAKLWQENEENLSKFTLNYITYSNKLHESSAASTTNSVKSHFAKKYLSPVVESKPNEMAMLKLLGRLQDQTDIVLHNPIHDSVAKEIEKRSKEFSSNKIILLFASTFNVNGATCDEDLKEWLFPTKHNITKSYDLVLIGIQEIVELNASQMVNTETQNKLFWEKKLKESLDEHNPDQTKYVSLWTGQIGGIALLLFIKKLEMGNVSNVEGAFKKTGLGGMSANKGAVAVSIKYSNTHLCFVLAHLAAGLSNIEERHHNYKTLVKGLKFSKNRRIKDHDAVVWLGDFNFRIGLPNEQVKPLIEQEQFNRLFEFDQLNKQMADGETFPFFDEMEIKFPPTYKFDHGTNVYDTSEKQRIPAWTDRILNLSQKKITKQQLYDCVSTLTFSDHRPVIAVFDISVNIVNEKIKKDISFEIYENYRKKLGGDINDLFIANNNLSFLVNGNESRLPAPSSEVTKWWLQGGLPAKIQIPELNNTEGLEKERVIINPKRPLNPFEYSDEPEFITYDQLMKLLV